MPRYGFSPRRVSILDKRCLTDSSVAVTLQQKIAHVDRLPVFGQAAQSIGTVLQLFFHVATSWLLYANLNLTYRSTVCLCTCQGHWQYLRERPEPALWLGDSDIRTSIASNISSSLFSSCMRFLHYFLPYYLSAYHDLSSCMSCIPYTPYAIFTSYIPCTPYVLYIPSMHEYAHEYTHTHTDGFGKRARARQEEA